MPLNAAIAAAQFAQLRAQLRGVRVLGNGRVVNPLASESEYQATLKKFKAAYARLGAATDPAAARKIVDEMNRSLLDVRGSLWKIEQKRKAAEKAPAERMRREEKKK